MNETPTRFKFTNRRIADLPPNPDDARSTEAEYSDTDVTGLRCLVGKGRGVASSCCAIRYMGANGPLPSALSRVGCQRGSQAGARLQTQNCRRR